MTITIHLFAMLADQLGPTIDVEVPADATEASVKAVVATQYPEVQQVTSNARLAVNQEFVSAGPLQLTATDEIALIPPVSGG